jgi:hypothetical protein
MFFYFPVVVAGLRAEKYVDDSLPHFVLLNWWKEAFRVAADGKNFANLNLKRNNYFETL